MEKKHNKIKRGGAKAIPKRFTVGLTGVLIFILAQAAGSPCLRETRVGEKLTVGYFMRGRVSRRSVPEEFLQLSGLPAFSLQPCLLGARAEGRKNLQKPAPKPMEKDGCGGVEQFLQLLPPQIPNKTWGRQLGGSFQAVKNVSVVSLDGFAEPSGVSGSLRVSLGVCGCPLCPPPLDRARGSAGTGLAEGSNDLREAPGLYL